MICITYLFGWEFSHFPIERGYTAIVLWSEVKKHADYVDYSPRRPSRKEAFLRYVGDYIYYRNISFLKEKNRDSYSMFVKEAVLEFKGKKIRIPKINSLEIKKTKRFIIQWHK